MSGQTFVSNVDRGAALSEQIDADIVIFEGSGSSIPSVHTDARILVIGAIRGKRVVLTLTAPPVMTDAISAHLENTYGCEVLGVSTHLSNRPLLREDLARFAALKPDVIVSELKAAAVDVIGRRVEHEKGRYGSPGSCAAAIDLHRRIG